MGSALNQVKAVKDLPKSDEKLYQYALTLGQKTTNNPNLTSPGTVLTSLAAATTAFGVAIQNMATVKGAGPARAAAKLVLVEAIDHVVDLVNGAAEKAPVGQAAAIFASAGFRTKKIPVRTTAELTVDYGDATGAVLLVALAAAKSAVYYFQYSTDMKTWVSCPNVMKCKTVVTGLTVGTTYCFRFQAQTRKSVGAWSEVVSFVVR
jgi:hypothetical protein